jgi:ribosome-associated protein
VARPAPAGYHLVTEEASRVDTPIDIPETDEALIAQCRVQTFRATGPGGQGVNTTDSAVRIVHLPTGVMVTCRRERSQLVNKLQCIRRLRAKLEAMNEVQAPRVPTKEPRSVKRNVLDSKVRRGVVKRLRKPPTGHDE